MQVNQKIAQNKRMYIVMLLIGLIALFTGFVLQIEKDLMLGISCGFIPTGIGDGLSTHEFQEISKCCQWFYLPLVNKTVFSQ